MKLEERFSLNENQAITETILFYEGHLLALARQNFELEININGDEELALWILYKNQQFRTDARQLDLYPQTAGSSHGSFSIHGDELFAVYNNTIYSIDLRGLIDNNKGTLVWKNRTKLRYERYLQKSFWIDNELIVAGGAER